MDRLQLRALEIQGFKSFPDKTVLQFDANITAIVGPNGSGKSNISDAIRWVMGEQSTRTLRGGKMEDVIFGGTEKRRSHGFAEVSLILDNEDGHFPVEDSEIMVTRRYYRSGDSEYYINRHLVRLRDINELFMDTGLGQDGYCLVGQGKIDEILSVKSTQRREVFEEAAGISRYRHKKEEAERKLERTKENLLRVGDKIEELELQVEPLREQAEKAKRYFCCQEELRLLEISLWMDRLVRLRGQHETVREAFAAMSRQLEEAKLESERLYAVSETLYKAAQVKEEAIEDKRRQESQLEEQSAACEQRLSVLQVRVKNNRDTIVRLLQEQKAGAHRGDSLDAQMQQKQESLHRLSIEEGSCRDSMQQLETKLRELGAHLRTFQEQLDRLEEQAQQETQSVQRVQSLLSALGASSQEVVEREEGLSRNLEETEAQLQVTAQAEAELQKQQTLLDQQKKDQTQTVNQGKEHLTRCKTKEQQAQEVWVGLRMEENTLSARIRMLEEMEKHYEGYSKSVKTVMEEADAGRLGGVHGPVASILQVPEPYTIAIEIALGGAMQNLVVETEQHGKAVLAELKRKDAGRVTCLPMTAIRASKLDARGFSKEAGYLGIASDLVNVEKPYANIVSHLLGRVVIVQDLDSGIAMARQFEYRFRIVTLDGQVLSPGGAMTGGSVSRKGGILTRAKELGTLSDKQEALKKRRLSAEEGLEQAKRETLAKASVLEIAEGEARQLENNALLVAAQRKGLQAQTEQLGRQRERLRLEMEQLQRKAAENQDRKAQAQEKIVQIETASLRLLGKRNDEETERDELISKREGLLEELREVRTKLAVCEAERRVTNQALLELRQLRDNLALEHQRKGEDMEALDRETQTLLAACREEENRGRDLQNQKADCLEILQALNRDKLELEASRNQTDRESRKQSETMLYAQRETAVLEQKKLSHEQEEAQLLDKLWEHYEIAHEAARAICIPVHDPAQTEKRIGALKGEIRGLGHVNLGAVEEYERISERYGYLQEQRQDVEEAAAQLVEIIEAIVGQMRTIFKREFARINEAFSETFVTLFQGGKAELVLEDERDILSCGIEIKVQPPGKSLKHLSLLSGGEKAFVAIALYFAILKVRPTPFCVLDEIEAALDDVNVFRFSRYLRSISTKTQFIVITHRRGTMEEADVLYGVTMEQQGTSRILRLNLNEAALALEGAVK